MPRWTALALLLTACSATIDAGSTDVAVSSDLSVSDRSGSVTDLARGAEAAFPSDQATPTDGPLAADLTAPSDGAPLTDIFAPFDEHVSEDLGAAADLAGKPDLAQGASDLAQPRDLKSTDLAPGVRFTFVSFADNQFATTSCTSGVSERLAVPQAISKLSPTFVIEPGDLMDHGYDAGAYAQFESCYASTITKEVFFPAPGNHDEGSAGILNFKKFLESRLKVDNPKIFGSTYANTFRIAYEDDATKYSTDPSHPTMTNIVPSGFTFKTFYAFRYKNSYFLSFEQGTRWWTNTPKTWVEKHLKAARADPTIEHVFVYLHHPLYSTTMDESSSSGEAILPVRTAYEALFRQYDVTAVFSGHVHLYEHFYVPDSGAATRATGRNTYPHDGKGVHYIINGGGGGPLPGCSPMPGEKKEKSYDYRQARGCGYHFVHVAVDGGKVTLQTIGVTGSASSYKTSTWDSFTIE